jgi:GH24 family phage-related lysozyme (muramidase)
VSTYDEAALDAELSRDEGRRNRIYTDTVGKVSGGVGRNLTDVGFSDDEIDLMYRNDVARTLAFLDENLPWWRNLDGVRQRAIINMAFNLRARLIGFHNALTAMQSGDWQTAHDQMLDSVWAKQVGERATRLANMILTGAADVSQ